MTSVAGFFRRGKEIADKLLSNTIVCLLVTSTTGLVLGLCYSFVTNPVYVSTAILRTPPAVPVEVLAADTRAVDLSLVSVDSVAIRAATQLINSTDPARFDFPVLRSRNPLDLTTSLVARRLVVDLDLRPTGDVIFVTFRSSIPEEARRVAGLASTSLLEIASPTRSIDGNREGTSGGSVGAVQPGRSSYSSYRNSPASLDSLGVGFDRPRLDGNVFNHVSPEDIEDARETRAASTYSIIQEASLPLVPVNRPFYLNMLAGILAFGLAGAVTSIGYRRYQPFVRRPEDVYADDITWKGVLPKLRKQRTRNGPAGNRQKVWELYPTSQSSSHPLAILLQDVEAASEADKIIVTSPTPRAGTTMVSWNLAMLYSRMGRTTLLIEADQVNRPLGRKLSNDITPGLLDILWGKSGRASTIREVRNNLFLLASGSIPEGILPVQAEWVRLMSMWESRYDKIILDIPSTASLEEKEIFADWANIAIVIADASRTTKRSLSKCLSIVDENDQYVLVNKDTCGGSDGVEQTDSGWYLAVNGTAESATVSGARIMIEKGRNTGTGADGPSGGITPADLQERLDEILAPYRPNQGDEQVKPSVSI